MAEKSLDQLDAPARDLAERSIAWMDRYWDEAAGLFRVPDYALYERGQVGVTAHLGRETAWYVLGLLLRDGPGDRVRATHAIDTVLTYQFDVPGQPYHGTWYRFPQEPPPPANPIVWRDYDPNWREFIGTSMALVLLEYEGRLPADLVRRIDIALRRAIVGTLERNVPASYTNIALMTAFLLQFAADRYGEPAWAATSKRLAAEILQRFRANNTFDEYNSPTYYGIDLYALALWRSYASLALLREAGAEMKARYGATSISAPGCATSPGRTTAATGWICGATWLVWACGSGWRPAMSRRRFRISTSRSSTLGISRSRRCSRCWACTCPMTRCRIFWPSKASARSSA
jgi:hypothetical protein